MAKISEVPPLRAAIPHRRLACVVAILVISLTPLCSAAQDNDGFPKKTGVADASLKHSMAELHPSIVFPVSGHPDWLAVTEDAVWVTSSNVNHVVRLDAITNKPDVVVSVDKPCSGLVVAFKSLWIPSCGAHNLVRVDARTGAVQATVAAGPADSEGGIAAGGGSIWLVSSASSELDRIDPSANKVTARIQLPKGSYNPVFAGDSVWVSSYDGNALIRVDPTTNSVLGLTSIGPKPRFLTSGAGSIWVLNQGDGSVSRVDDSTGKLISTIPAGIPGLGGEIAFGGGSVWATVFDYPITRIDPATNRVTQQWVGTGGDSIRYAHGSIWLTFLLGAKVWRMDVPRL